MQKLLFIFGTRPEAIKLCPLINHLRRETHFATQVCVTAQHRAMLDQVLEAFHVQPDYDLDLMQPDQTLFQSTSRMLAGLESVFADARPDMIMVQGDTTSTLCGGLGAFYARIPLGHVEAGLRTGDLAHPFPEEANRVLVSRVAGLHFAATEWSAANLTREGVAAHNIVVTGNTGIDALLYVRDGLRSGRLSGGNWPQLDPSRKLILVTAHRRESFGDGFEKICRALARIARRPDVQIAFPVHPNPQVRRPVEGLLSKLSNVLLLEPQAYVPFVDLMSRAHLILTDSGGIQEEAPSLGKPLLVLRETTERPEGIATGTVRLVGTNEDAIVRESAQLLEEKAGPARMAHAHNPYGDGHASERIAGALQAFLAPRVAAHAKVMRASA